MRQLQTLLKNEPPPTLETRHKKLEEENKAANATQEKLELLIAP
jgi:hypothetical protein